LFQAYLDRHLAQARLTLQSEWIANAQRIEALAQKQQKLEVQAKAISSRSGDLSQSEANLKRRIARAKANIRRIQDNERFAKWLDNASWALQRCCETVVHKVNWWSGDIKVLFAVVGVSLFVVTPVSTTLSLRLLLSDRCIRNQQCRAVAIWMADISPRSRPKSKPANPDSTPKAIKD
jgi:hypothetical protein